MRLIDADAVKDYILRKGFYCDTEADKEYTAEQIDIIFPTVEAIPIHWIYRWVEKIPENWRGYSDYNITGLVKNLVYKGNPEIPIPSISDMLDDWDNEKEDYNFDSIPIDYLQYLLTTGDFRDYNFSSGIKKAIEMWREENGKETC